MKTYMYTLVFLSSSVSVVKANVMEHVVYVLLANILCSIFIKDIDGLLCYSCSNIETSEDCLHIEQCSVGEECFTRADGLINGTVKYTTGCTVNMGPLVSKGITFCSQTCNENLCNLDKCQLPVSPRSNVTRPPRCLSCNLVRDPALCETLVQCKKSEVCFVRQIITYGNTRYRMGCMDQQHCLDNLPTTETTSVLVGKRSQESCSFCCSTDHCNNKICQNGHNIPRDKWQNLKLIGDDQTCFDFNAIACAAFGSLSPLACEEIPDVDTLCPESCGICGHYGWTSWGEWSGCSKTCDLGYETRRRLCMHQIDVTKNNTCLGNFTDNRTCNIEPCKINGQWSDWMDWTNCSASCENGTRIRQRNCSNPTPEFGGQNCTGDSLEVDICYGQPCPVHGGWCSESGQVCYKYHWNSYYEFSRNAIVRGNCSCPEPENGGNDCI